MSRGRMDGGAVLVIPKSNNHGNALLMLSSSLAKQKLKPTATQRSNSTMTGENPAASSLRSSVIAVHEFVD